MLSRQSTLSYDIGDHNFASDHCGLHLSSLVAQPTTQHGPAQCSSVFAAGETPARADSIAPGPAGPSEPSGHVPLRDPVGLIANLPIVPSNSLGPVADMQRAARNGDVRAQQVVAMWKKLEDSGQMNLGQGITNQQPMTRRGERAADTPVQAGGRPIGERKYINSGVYYWTGTTWEVERPPPNIQNAQPPLQSDQTEATERRYINGRVYRWDGTAWDAVG